MNEAKHEVFTIGHSNHPVTRFVELLRCNGVQVVADVRSTPRSMFNPQYDQKSLAQSLIGQGIKYVFLGRELGGRPKDANCYENGRVQYARVALTPLFRSGISRLVRGSNEYIVAIMCSEKEPLECHRALLIAPALVELGIRVKHILANGQTETYEDAMERLVVLTGTPEEDMFRSRVDVVAESIKRQSARIAFVDKSLATDSVREEP
ncbi:MAG TPA: DUF488 domain-containing protein [Spirochaetia bacterium]|nr:DUF488 domain-containing protein [Spirochaetia bacterium]